MYIYFNLAGQNDYIQFPLDQNILLMLPLEAFVVRVSVF